MSWELVYKMGILAKVCLLEKGSTKGRGLGNSYKV